MKWIDQYKDQMDPELTIGAIYGGIGSTMIGPVQEGFTPKFIIEPRKGYLSEDTIKENWGNLPISTELNKFPRTKTTLIVAQPACKNYSLLNRNMTREKLYQIDPDEAEYIRFLKQIRKRRPEFFILENLWRIRDFLFFPEEEGDAQFYAATTVGKDGKAAGVTVWVDIPNYTVHHFRIDAAQYGVPQSRKRLFIVGHKSKYDDFFSYQPPNPEWDQKEDFKTVREALEGLGKAANTTKGEVPDVPNHVTAPLTPRQDRLITGTRPGEKNSNKERKLEWDRYSPTIVSSSIRHIHPHFLRYLTPREAARLMGYPDSFIFHGSINQTLDQIGRAICPEINRHLSLAIKRCLRRYHNKGQLSNLFAGVTLSK